MGIRHEPHRSDCKVTGASVGRPQRCGLFDCCPPLCSRQNGVQLGLWLSRPISKGAKLEREAQPVVSPAPHPDMLDVVVGQRVMAQQRRLRPWAGRTAPRADARSRCFVSACSTSPLSVHPGRRGAVRKGIVQRTAQSVAPTPAKPEPSSVSYEWYGNNCGSGTLSVHFPP